MKWKNAYIEPLHNNQFHEKATEMDKYNELRDMVSSLEDDFSKFYEKGNKAAGTRVRKGMQDLKKLAQEIRVDVQSKKVS